MHIECLGSVGLYIKETLLTYRGHWETLITMVVTQAECRKWMQAHRDTQKHTHRHAHSEANTTPFEAKQTNNPLAISYLCPLHRTLRLCHSGKDDMYWRLKLFLDFCPDFTGETGMLPTLNEATVTKYWGNEGTSQVKSISWWLR